jgi:hypothetical protein
MLYGVRMNKFGDWKSSTEDNIEIVKRAEEIRELIEQKRPEAKENIEKAQEKQKQVQDKRNRAIKTWNSCDAESGRAERKARESISRSIFCKRQNDRR